MIASGKKIVPVILLLFALAIAATPVKAQIGFAGGYSMNMASSPSFSGGAQNSFDPAGGFSFGMFYDFRFGRITLRPGVFIRQADFDWELAGINPNLNPLKSSVRVAEFPIDLLFHFGSQGMNPYVLVGPSFSFLHTDQPDLRQTLDNPKGSTSYTSFTLGAGIEIQPAGWGIILSPEVRYGLALSGFQDKEYIVRTVSYTADSSQKLSSLVIRMGITLPSF